MREPERARSITITRSDSTGTGTADLKIFFANAEEDLQVVVAGRLRLVNDLLDFELAQA